MHGYIQGPGIIMFNTKMCITLDYTATVYSGARLTRIVRVRFSYGHLLYTLLWEKGKIMEWGDRI